MADLNMVSLVLLQQHGLPGSKADTLAELLRSSWQQECGENHIICREGEPGDELWVLAEGSVRVTKKDFLNSAQDLAVIPAPAVLGLVSLVDGGKRSAGLVADDTCSFITIDRKRFDALMEGRDEQSQTFRKLLVASLSRQLSRGRASLRNVLREARGVDELSVSAGELQADSWRQ